MYTSKQHTWSILTLTRIFLYWQPIILILTHSFINHTSSIRIHTHNYKVEWRRSGRGCGNILSPASPFPWGCVTHSRYPQLSILSRNLIPNLCINSGTRGSGDVPRLLAHPTASSLVPLGLPIFYPSSGTLRFPWYIEGARLFSS